MGRDQNRRGSGSDQGDDGNWDDWFSEFDPERTKPMPRQGGDSGSAGEPRKPYRPPVPGGYDDPYRGQEQPPDDYGYPQQPPAPRDYQQPPRRQQPPAGGYSYPQPPQDDRRRGRLDETQLPQTPGSAYYDRTPASPQRQRNVAPQEPAQQRRAAPQPASTPRSQGQSRLAPGGGIPPTRGGSGSGRRRGSRARRAIFGFFVIALIFFCAVIGFYAVRLQQVGEGVFVDSGRPTQTVSLTERRNILLLGLDTRSEDDSRSDTMILVTVDPVGKTAGMLSVPRDLWVQIPDFEGESFGENRINSAYQFGKNSGVENGGPLLAIKTFEENFQVNIDNFVEVNFAGFSSIVDALGGVTVDVPRPLIDNEYPADYGSAYQRLYIPSGIQHLDGRTALQYVRSRHADSDLGRNQRQQGVLLAIKEQALQLNMITRLDDVLKEITGTVKTNMSLDEVVALGNLARDLPRDRVLSVAVDANMTTPALIGGNDVLLPRWEVIRPAVQQMLTNPVLGAESAAIVVHNGTDTPGLATKGSELLSAAGLRVAGVGNPPDGGGGRYPTTLIYDYSAGTKTATIAEIRRLLNIEEQNVRDGSTTERPPGADILVMIGDDKVTQLADE